MPDVHLGKSRVIGWIATYRWLLVHSGSRIFGARTDGRSNGYSIIGIPISGPMK